MIHLKSFNNFGSVTKVLLFDFLDIVLLFFENSNKLFIVIKALFISDSFLLAIDISKILSFF